MNGTQFTPQPEPIRPQAAGDFVAPDGVQMQWVVIGGLLAVQAILPRPDLGPDAEGNLQIEIKMVCALPLEALRAALKVAGPTISKEGLVL